MGLSMALQDGICLPANSPGGDIPKEADARKSGGISSNPILAQATLVSTSPPVVHGGPVASTSQKRLALSRSSAPPSSTQATPSGMEVDRRRLARLGCSASVIKTLALSRKHSTNATYDRVWTQFCAFAQAQGFSPEDPSVPEVLEFLQKGLDMGLSLSTLKGQVSAISAFTSVQWATVPLVTRFFKAVIRLKPPKGLLFPKWDLSLVLDLLVSQEFLTNQETSLYNLTLKTVFLVAITSASRVSELAALSAREPFTVFFEDRVVLTPVKGFIPKVPSKFHLKREIVLPTFKSPGSEEPSQLDVVSTLRAYIEATDDIRDSEHLFVVPNGVNAGRKASSRVISAWLVKVITKAYETKGLPVPSGIRAHSTRGMATSWAAAGRLSLEDICKAASWSSSHTFLSHYCIEPAALTSVNFGHTVLTSALAK